MSRNVFENDSVKMLIKAITRIRNEKECVAVLSDLLTTKEILDISQRLQVAKMLSEKVVYSKIAETTGASTTTISRVNHSFQYGDGGYQLALKRTSGKKEE